MVSIISAARDIARVREVSAVLVKHGFGEVAGRLGIRGRPKSDGGDESGDADRSAPGETSRSDRSGRSERPPNTRTSFTARARLVLEDLGPSFVKLGQLASTRPDLLPEELIQELKKLQDNVPPLPFEQIEAQIERSLGAPVAAVYESFERTPIAAASIAQVHRATLRTEDGVVDVAVKVQRPGIASTIASDLDILHMLAALLERAIPESRIYSPTGLVQQFDHAINAELDFTSEADNARRFTENFEGDPHVRFPLVYRQASSRNVLTMEFLGGAKINQAIEAGHSGKNIARLAFRTMTQQIYEDGFFHADPHPGNVLIDGTEDAPVLCLLDLGMVGRLSPRLRDLTVDVIVAALRRDYDGIAEALYAIGTPSKKIKKEAYRAEVALLSEKYLGKQLADIEMSALIRDLVRAATRYGIEIPTDFVMMGKALMTVEGIGKEIDPSFDIYEEARPLFTEILKKRYSPERMGSELLRRVERLGGASYKVPQQVEEALDDLLQGRLKLRLDNSDHAEATARAGRRLAAALMSSSLVIGGAMIISAGQRTLGYVLLGLALVPLGLYAVSEALRSIGKR